VKLVAAIAIHVPAEDVLRELRFFERIRRAFGGKPDLRTGRVRASIEATAIVEAARDALRLLGVTNAISLSVDDTTLFHDRESKPDDLGDLLVAFHDNESVFGQGFRELRLAVEHHEAGLHLVAEITARSEHAEKAPTVRIVVSGRIAALAPLPSEDADAYRARTQPLVKDAAAFTGYELQFKSFIDRLRDALAASLPVGRVEVEGTETRIVRPSDKPASPQTEPDRASRAYDPYDHYYPGYFAASAMLDVMIWSTIFSHAFHPHYVVVNNANQFEGHADDKGIESGPTAEASDASHWNEADSATDASATDDSRWGTNEDAMNTSNDQSDSGADSGGDSGGDFGGGGDGGGFDFDFD
jgi:hypothetical protein